MNMKMIEILLVLQEYCYLGNVAVMACVRNTFLNRPRLVIEEVLYKRPTV